MRPYLQRRLAEISGGIANVHFVMPSELALKLGERAMQTEGRMPLPPLADRILLREIATEHEGYFEPGPRDAGARATRFTASPASSGARAMTPSPSPRRIKGTCEVTEKERGAGGDLRRVPRPPRRLLRPRRLPAGGGPRGVPVGAALGLRALGVLAGAPRVHRAPRRANPRHRSPAPHRHERRRGTGRTRASGSRASASSPRRPAQTRRPKPGRRWLDRPRPARSPRKPRPPSSTARSPSSPAPTPSARCARSPAPASTGPARASASTRWRSPTATRSPTAR